ncbi:MAG: 3-isopropylmalate dehydratase small subunit [spirochete symbiont of Stewartia floridana]|nr:MAG: 3-isopropylmalate dehydratase small subunit [spirochete symbiont of Stewartia floridana]
MNQSISSLKGRGIAVRGNDIDTDRIIPARFMKVITFSGLGAHVFHDERFDDNGASKGHPFDDARFASHSILLVNANFGCGSSREHAPQSLKDYGIRAIIGESFAEIFAGNCSSLGIPAVMLKAAEMSRLQDQAERHPETEICIDLVSMTVEADGNRREADMPNSYRQALLDGTWDSTAVLAESMDAIEKVAAKLPYMETD